MADQSKTALITTMKNEFFKNHYLYDGDNRVTHHFQARNGAENNTPCMVTQFDYLVGTSLVSGWIEYEGRWNSSWDIEPDMD